MNSVQFKMVSARSEKPTIKRSTSSLISFPNVVFETVPPQAGRQTQTSKELGKSGLVVSFDLTSFGSLMTSEKLGKRDLKVTRKSDLSRNGHG